MGKLTRKVLETIIREELEKVANTKLAHLSDKDKKKRKNKQREEQRDQDELRWGDREGHLRQLANGITEYGKYFDEKGHFTSKDNASCVSDTFKTGNPRKRTSGGLTKQKDTGRGRSPNKGKGQYRCYDDKKLWEQDDEGFIHLRAEDVEELVKDKVVDFLSGYIEHFRPENRVLEDDQQKKLDLMCRRRGYKTFRDFLLAINQIERSKKGDLLKPEKD